MGCKKAVNLIHNRIRSILNIPVQNKDFNEKFLRLINER